MIETTNVFLNNEIKEFHVSERDIIRNSSSKGNQEKWFIDNCFVKAQFFYEDKYWNDNVVEVCASNICNQLGIYHVEQHLCKIVTEKRILFGSYSINFNDVDEQFIPYEKLFRVSKEFELPVNATAVQRIEQVLEVYSNFAWLDASEYIQEMIMIDFLIGNEDRHLNNFGVIRNTISGECRLPPLFDFGIAMFEHDLQYANLSLINARRNMVCKPFSTDFDKQIKACKTVFKEHKFNKLTLSKLQFPNSLSELYVKHSAKILGIEVD